MQTDPPAGVSASPIADNVMTWYVVTFANLSPPGSMISFFFFCQRLLSSAKLKKRKEKKSPRITQKRSIRPNFPSYFACSLKFLPGKDTRTKKIDNLFFPSI
jgi:hypothetical protein